MVPYLYFCCYVLHFLHFKPHRSLVWGLSCWDRLLRKKKKKTVHHGGQCHFSPCFQAHHGCDNNLHPKDAEAPSAHGTLDYLALFIFHVICFTNCVLSPYSVLCCVMPTIYLVLQLVYDTFSVSPTHRLHCVLTNGDFRGYMLAVQAVSCSF